MVESRPAGKKSVCVSSKWILDCEGTDVKDPGSTTYWDLVRLRRDGEASSNRVKVIGDTISIKNQPTLALKESGDESQLNLPNGASNTMVAC